jgi:GTPase
MNKELLRTGDKGHVKFRFMYRPEYLKPGTTILFREGRTKGLGVVTQCTPPSTTV